MEQNEEFRQESLADKDTVIRYLATLTKGLEDGKIQLELQPETISMIPAGLINMEIKAKKKDKKVKLSMKLSWTDAGN